MNDDGTNEYEDSLVDLSDDTTWFTSDVETQLNNFLESLYAEGCGINGITIELASIAGDGFTYNSEFGPVEFRSKA